MKVYKASNRWGGTGETRQFGEGDSVTHVNSEKEIRRRVIISIITAYWSCKIWPQSRISDKSFITIITCVPWWLWYSDLTKKQRTPYISIYLGLGFKIYWFLKNLYWVRSYLYQYILQLSVQLFRLLLEQLTPDLAFKVLLFIYYIILSGFSVLLWTAVNCKNQTPIFTLMIITVKWCILFGYNNPFLRGVYLVISTAYHYPNTP